MNCSSSGFSLWVPWFSMAPSVLAAWPGLSPPLFYFYFFFLFIFYFWRKLSFFIPARGRASGWERRSRGNIRYYIDQKWGKDNSPSFFNPSLAFPPRNKTPQQTSLGPQLSGKDVFHWTRGILEYPKCWCYKGFCITLADNSPRSLCKYSHEWKLGSSFAGICNSFYSRWLFLAEIAPTKGE